jgi:hypothetical protein
MCDPDEHDDAHEDDMRELRREQLAEEDWDTQLYDEIEDV